MESNVPEAKQFTWKCACCNQERRDMYIRVRQHDISVINGWETGTAFINVKYCGDMKICEDKATDREWVLNHFLPNREKK